MLLTGWNRTFLPDGVRLVSPDRSSAITVRPRATPLVRFATAIDRQLRSLPPSARGSARVSGPRRGHTSAGEPFAAASITASHGETRLTSELATVYTQAFMMTVVGHGSGDDAADRLPLAVDEIAKNCWVGLPTTRVRWFHYTPPVGWRPLRRQHMTLWFAPDFPARRATLHVLDARPLGTGSSSLLLGGPALPAVAESEPSALASPSGLVGQSWPIAPYVLEGIEYRATEVRLEDAHFAYLVRLDSERAVHGSFLDTLHDLVGSIEPIRAAEPTQAAAPDAFSLWTE